MDNLPNSILLKILTHLADSSDVARCRVASNSFNTVHPGLKSINLQCSLKQHHNGSTSRVLISNHIKTVFLDLISKLETVESVSIVVRRPAVRETDDFYLTDDVFADEWLPRVSGSLKSLLVTDYGCDSPSSVLQLVSEYCHNLLSLKLQWAWLSVDNLKPMQMLTSLTLSFTRLEDEHLNEFNNNSFPNLQLLKLVAVQGLRYLKIHLLNLKTCSLTVFHNPPSLTLITPNLTRLSIECANRAELVLDAPMLSNFYLGLTPLHNFGSFTIKKFQHLKTLWIGSPYIASILSDFPITKTVEELTLDSMNDVPRDPTDPKLTIEKVFTVFPNMSSLCLNSGAWSELEACLIPEGEESSDGRKGLKTICAYLELVNSSLTFSYVARVLDQCVGLSEVLLLIHADVDDTLSESFKSKCVARWPGLKWRWGVWSDEMEDSWITDTVSN